MRIASRHEHRYLRRGWHAYGSAGIVMGVASLAFVALLLSAGRRTSDDFAESLRLRFENEDLSKDLAAKQVRLEATLQERQELVERLNTQAGTDRLTGALNRLRFDEILGMEMKRTSRYGEPLSLIMLRRRA